MTHSIPPDGSAHVLLMVGSCLFRLPVIVQGKRVSTEHIQAAIQVCTQPRLLALMETCPASRFWIEAERWPLDITALTLIQDAIDDADARPASVFGASRYADPPHRAAHITRADEVGARTLAAGRRGRRER